MCVRVCVWDHACVATDTQPHMLLWSVGSESFVTTEEDAIAILRMVAKQMPQGESEHCACVRVCVCV